ncbi:MAG: tRNA pseudouridine(38-40) synthase TruA [Armatimonadota bacterium]|nr:tRNA pseudouridine(38-40) synthase TruA [Armatimonadota bacterium]
MHDAERYLATLPRSTAVDAEGFRNLAVLLEYDGTGFLGFQRQAYTPTIQQSVEEGLERILKHPVRVVAAGRTDAGVHALGQVIAFRTKARIPEERVPAALNSVLPPSIVARGAAQVSPGFSPRYSARRRVYAYVIDAGKYPSPFTRRFSWHYPWPLDVAAMNEAARRLCGTHDFRSFCVEAGAYRNTVRTLGLVRCRRRRHFLVTVVRANAFLRGMVRAILGTLVDVGRGRLAPQDVERILAARDRAAASGAAPPQGLCLVRVDY